MKTTSHDVPPTGPFKRSEANLAERPRDPFAKYDAKHSGFFAAHSVWVLVFFVVGDGCFCLFGDFVCWLVG